MGKILSVLSVLKSIFLAKESNFDNICIKGSKEFQERVSSALSLLKERAPEIFQIADASLFVIFQGKQSTLVLEKSGGGLCLGEENINSSPTWLAGMLAYYGARAGLYLENLKKYGSAHKIPKDAYSGQKVWDTHYKCLQELDASYEELKCLSDFIETRE